MVAMIGATEARVFIYCSCIVYSDRLLYVHIIMYTKYIFINSKLLLTSYRIVKNQGQKYLTIFNILSLQQISNLFQSFIFLKFECEFFGGHLYHDILLSGGPIC